MPAKGAGRSPIETWKLIVIAEDKLKVGQELRQRCTGRQRIHCQTNINCERQSKLRYQIPFVAFIF